MEPYTLLGPDGPYPSAIRGELRGHRRKKIYGGMECYSANNAIAKGGYVDDRVFFKDEKTAIACGYRPCAKCMPVEYKKWKAEQK